MKASCLQDQLQHALGQVSRAVAAKTALPVLANVLISTEEDRVRIAATNLEIGITTWIPASVEEAGQITVDARLLSEFVNTLPNAPVELSYQEPRMVLTVRSGRDKAGINGIDADDFPVIPSLDAEDEAYIAEVDPQLFKEMIAQVEFSAASDDSRPVLAGVLTRFEGDRLTLATADGFRLAVRHGSLLQPVPERLDTIVPAKAMRELARLIGDQTEPLRLAITKSRNQLLARVGETEFLSRLIEGMFPDFNQIIPKEYATRVELGRETFSNAVRRASYFARENNDVVRLVIHPSDDELAPGSVEVLATAAERGNSQSFVDATIEGGEGQIAFNARYLADVLGVLKDREIVLCLNGQNQAGIVRSPENDDYTHVIMPMVIGGL